MCTAADAVNQAWVAWRRLTGSWDLISTNADQVSDVSPVAAEAADLALRMGRLAYHDPRWIPACDSARLTCDPATLFPSAGEMRIVLAAVHHAADAINQIATQDRNAVHNAAAGRRLYMPTRLLPARNTTPHQHSPAPGTRVDALLADYDHVVSDCSTATAALDDLAISTETASRTQGLARRLAESSPALAAEITATARGVDIETEVTASPGARTQQSLGRRASRTVV
jgi:hypothetical protein